jgi:hypothetical protein
LGELGVNLGLTHLGLTLGHLSLLPGL